MQYEPSNIISRIEWCRFQQRLHTVTKDERAGWMAEEAGLVDALDHRDRIAFMREEHSSQFIRYLCGLEDGRALLRLSNRLLWDRARPDGLGLTPITPPAWVDRPSSRAPSRVHVGRSRR